MPNSDQESKPDNPCTVCMKHSGVETQIGHHEQWLKTLSKRFNTIMVLLITDLALLVIFLVIHGLPMVR